MILKTITNLCIACNALDGADCIENHKKNEEIRQTVYDVMMKEAARLHFKKRVSLEALRHSIEKAGWEEQYFVQVGRKPKLKIKYEA